MTSLVRLRIIDPRHSAGRLSEAKATGNSAALPAQVFRGSSRTKVSRELCFEKVLLFQSSDDVIASFLTLHPLLVALSDSFTPEVTSQAEQFRAIVLDLVVAEHVALRNGLAPNTAKYGEIFKNPNSDTCTTLFECLFVLLKAGSGSASVRSRREAIK